MTISKDISGRILVKFQYDPILVQKVKGIAGHKWHREGKYWSFPDTNSTLEKILKAFEGEEIQIDPTLQVQPSTHVIASHNPPRPLLRGAERRSNLKTDSHHIGRSTDLKSGFWEAQRTGDTFQ